MTPTPYVLRAESDIEGKRFSATLKYGETLVAEAFDLKESELEKWARTEASSHKASISPSEYHSKKVTVDKQIVL